MDRQTFYIKLKIRGLFFREDYGIMQTEENQVLQGLQAYFL